MGSEARLPGFESQTYPLVGELGLVNCFMPPFLHLYARLAVIIMQNFRNEREVEGTSKVLDVRTTTQC